MNALRQACVEVVEEHGVKLMLLTDYDIAKRFPEEQKGDGHGGQDGDLPDDGHRPPAGQAAEEGR